MVEDQTGLVNRPANTAGCQPVFTKEEEQRLIAHAIAMSSFGMIMFDLRCVVKAYPDQTGSVGFQRLQLSW